MSISIAIPFFNAEKYLPDAIRSVFCQTFENWELILVDDGSTDRSLEIALSVKDPRVTVISDGQNKKLAARLNQIVNISKYSLLARMDADDMMHPGRLTIQHKILLENPEVDLTGSGLYSINNDCDLIGIRGSFCNKITHFDLLRREIHTMNLYFWPKMRNYGSVQVIEMISMFVLSPSRYIYIEKSKASHLKN